MNYVEATLSEILRLANVAPTAFQHCTREDTTLLSHNIPKRTIVFPNLYSVMMDPKTWNEPNKFNPDRFLDDSGKLIKYDTMVPFGVGPRMCLGEPLAPCVHKHITKFKFDRESESFHHSLASNSDRLTTSPLSYKLRVKRR